MFAEIFFALALVLPVAGILTGAIWLTRPKNDHAKLVLLGVARSNPQAELWAERLHLAGIWCHIRNVGYVLGGDFITPGGTGPNAYEYEIWVRPKDEERARRLLGL